jgi:hypothetical protein
MVDVRPTEPGAQRRRRGGPEAEPGPAMATPGARRGAVLSQAICHFCLVTTFGTSDVLELYAAARVVAFGFAVMVVGARAAGHEAPPYGQLRSHSGSMKTRGLSPCMAGPRRLGRRYSPSSVADLGIPPVFGEVALWGQKGRSS